MSEGFRDCEYADVGVTRTQLLEEQIAILESKIQELEQPGRSNPSVLLTQPYTSLNVDHQYSSEMTVGRSRGSIYALLLMGEYIDQLIGLSVPYASGASPVSQLSFRLPNYI